MVDHARGEADRDRRKDGPPWPLCFAPDARGCPIGTDVLADPGAQRPAACAAGAGLIPAVLAEGKITGEVCIDDEKTGYERDEAAIGVDPCGPRTALAATIGRGIAVEIPIGYPDGQSWRSSGQCRLTQRVGISEIRSRASLSFRPVTGLDRQRPR